MLNSKRYSLFDGINGILLSVVMVIVLYPLYYTVIASVSDAKMVATGQVLFYPRGLNFLAYKNVFNNSEIWTGYANSVLYTVTGTLINLGVTLPCAYALARRELKGRNILMAVFVFTMYFGGGLIPTYLLMKGLHITDTRWAMILPPAMSVYNMIITRTYYQSSIPEQLYESARIDGCSELRIFYKIALPLSTPIVAVMALFYGVSHWNTFFSALIYLQDRKLYPLQLVLRNILLQGQEMRIDILTMTDEQVEMITKRSFMAEIMKYALIFIASAPVLAIYPFVQKYFVKGIMIGAIKG